MSVAEYEHGQSPTCLATVLIKVQLAPNLSVTQRRDLASALRTLERITGMPLTTIQADVPAVRRVLGTVLPARHGLSARRWKNVRSLVFKSLTCSVARQRGRHKSSEHSIGWRTALQGLPHKPYRLGLMPFVRFCNQQSIEPAQVCQRTFTDFESALEQFSGRARWRESHVAAVRAWKLAARDFPHWPQVEIATDDRRRWYSKPWSTFPPSLKADVDAMIKSATDPDPLSTTMLRPLRPATALARERAIRALASAIVLRGHDPTKLRSIADLVELDVLREGLRFFMEQTNQHRSAYIRDFVRLAIIMCRHWVFPQNRNLTDVRLRAREEHILALQHLRKQLKPEQTGMTAKNRSTLRHFEDDEIVGALLNLPRRIWARYDGKVPLKPSQLIELQVATAIELLLAAPIRRKNLTSIRPDRNLIPRGDGRKRRLHLYFSPKEVKNEFEVEFELPESTVQMFDRYMAEIRPQLPTSQSIYVFPGATGVSNKCPNLLSKQIAALTASEIGVRITAHQFRHIAGFLYLKSNPGGHEIVRRLLGHRSIETTLKFYAGMETSAALRHYDRLISSERERLRGPLQKRNRKASGRPQ